MKTLRMPFNTKLFFEKQRHAHLTIVALATVAWINPTSFLWRDEWTYLLYYYQNNFELFNGNFSFDVKPLYHYFLFFQFKVFADHFALYQLLNVLLFICCGLLFWKIVHQFQIEFQTALIMTLFYVLHPVNFVNLFWIFEQCELLHLVLILLAVLCFIRYLQKPTEALLLSYGVALALQNFFFPNGTFYSIFFLLWLIIDRYLLKPSQSDKLSWKIISVTILVFLLHLSHAIYIKGKMDQQYGLFSNLSMKFAFFLEFFTNTLLRLFIPNLKPLPFIINLLITAIFVGSLAVLFKKVDLKLKRLLLFASLAWIFASITLSLTRYDAQIILYYYTTLALPFAVMVLMVVVVHFRLLDRVFLKYIACVWIAVFLLLDFRGKRIFASRNKANIEKMKEAIKTRNYMPFDDPYFLPGEQRLDLKPYSYHEAPVVLYEFLKDGKKTN
jgi:hypothetical protein